MELKTSFFFVSRLDGIPIGCLHFSFFPGKLTRKRQNIGFSVLWKYQSIACANYWLLYLSKYVGLSFFDKCIDFLWTLKWLSVCNYFLKLTVFAMLCCFCLLFFSKYSLSSSLAHVWIHGVVSVPNDYFAEAALFPAFSDFANGE